MIRPADIRWRDDGAPESATYGDVYYSRQNGLEETRHVFLQQNGLPQRFQHHTHFTIAETGFGTGLNFLASWQAFVAHAAPEAVLHYISVEKHPLRQADLERALSAWPELRPFAAELLAAYPAPTPGMHRLLLAGGRVRLTLLYGDAEPMLQNATFKADAWYLDGFAPACNPEMWQEALIAHLPALSSPGATCATFTAAGQVKRALAQAGFTVEKVTGYGHKRDMLRGALPALPFTPPKQPRSVIVIGAGAAGASVALALALRGVAVTVVDRLPAPAQVTSANCAAILFPFASRAWMPHTEFYLAGLQFTHQQVQQLRTQGHAIAGAFCSMVQCPKPSQETAHLLDVPQRLALDASVVRAVNAEEASALSGLSVPSGALYWPQSGWYSLADYTRACLTHPAISLQMDTEITVITPCASGWAVYAGEHCIAQADTVVLANAAEAARLLPHLSLPLKTVRGQVTHLPASTPTQPLKTVLCFGGYLIPAHKGVHHLGATYEHHRQDTHVYTDSHEANLALARNTLGNALPHTLDAASLNGWAGLRTTTPDKLPLIGASDLPGIYLSVGHGSRAALSCPMAGEILASQMMEEIIPLSNSLRAAIHPTRFTVKP